MDRDKTQGVTQLLQDWQSGDPKALDQLTPMVYEELRRLANRHMQSENPGHTLQPTALIHEAYARLVDIDVSWKDRAHFFSVAARMMRRILVDHARAKGSVKRGQAQQHLSLDDVLVLADQAETVLLDLDEALKQLSEFDERKAQIVELLFFGGLSYEEVAETMDISRATVHREMTVAKAWLYNELKSDEA